MLIVTGPVGVIELPENSWCPVPFLIKPPVTCTSPGRIRRIPRGNRWSIGGIAANGERLGAAKAPAPERKATVSAPPLTYHADPESDDHGGRIGNDAVQIGAVLLRSERLYVYSIVLPVTQTLPVKLFTWIPLLWNLCGRPIGSHAAIDLDRDVAGLMPRNP